MLPPLSSTILTLGRNIHNFLGDTSDSALTTPSPLTRTDLIICTIQRQFSYSMATLERGHDAKPLANACKTHFAPYSTIIVRMGRRGEPCILRGCLVLFYSRSNTDMRINYRRGYDNYVVALGPRP